MRSLYRLWLLALVVCASSPLMAQTVTVGTGTNSTYFFGPIYRSSAASGFDYSRYSYLYTAAELGIPAGATITSVEWDKTSTSGMNGAATASFSIYMKNSAAASLTPAPWTTVISGATQVYANPTQVISTATGFQMFTLGTPFTYTGGNLEISTDWDVSAVAGNPTTGSFTWNTSLTPGMAIGAANSVSITGNLGTATYGDNRPNIRITYIPGAPCTGTPSAGTASAPAAACTGNNFNVTLTGYTAASGLTFDWQSSPDGMTWTSTGGTSATYTTSITSITYYQCIVTCTSSGMSDTSNVVSVTLNPFYNCYCVPGSTNGTGSGDYISGVMLDSINNVTGGAAAPYYTVYATPTTSLFAGSNYTITLRPGTYSSNDMAAWIDYDHDGVFNNTTEKLGETFNMGAAPATTSYSFTVPFTALPGITHLRVREADQGSTTMDPCLLYGFGETEDYEITIIIPPACTGTPLAGTATAIDSICPGVNFPIDVNGQTTDAGITTQWQSSPDGVTWSNMPGATTAPYTTSITSNTYYQCIITCTNSGMSDTSNVIFVAVNSFLDCYCASAAINTFDTKIDSVSVGTITTGSPAGLCETYTDYTALSTNLLAGVGNPIDIRNGSCSGSHFTAYVGVYIDYNQDGDFNDAGELATSFGPTTGLNTIPTLNITPPLSATPGTTGMRIVFAEGGAVTGPCATYFYGETEDYHVNIVIPPSCTGTPVAGTISAPSAVCVGENYNVSLTGYTTDLGISFDWQSSPDGITFTSTGDTTSSFSTSQTDTTYYQVIVTCNNSGLSATSSIFQVNISPFYDCYCQPVYTTGSGFGDYISLVYLDTINNATGASPMPYYTQYTTPTTTLYQGLTFNLTLQPGTYSFNDMAAWIDYNHDGIFDNTTEKIGDVYQLGPLPASQTFTFTVPVTALTGITALRVREADQGGILDPCNTYSFGETEDYLINIQTPGPCTNPAVGGTITGPSVDSVFQSGQYYVSGYNGNVQWYTSASPTGPWTFVNGGNNDTLNYTYNNGSDVYFMVIANSLFCPADTSNIFQTTVIFPGDDVCDAIPVIIGTNGPYNLAGASVEVGEPAPPATGCQTTNGWCNSTLQNTMWFKFVAPPSGRVIVQSPDFDTQLGVYDADSCLDVNSGASTLIGANDDDPQAAAHGGVTFSSFLRVNCLTPGKTYYIQLDGYSGPGTTVVNLTDPGFANPSFSGLDSVYCDANTNVTLTPVQNGGVFTGGNMSTNIFNPSVMGIGTDTITYTLAGCYSSSMVVNVYPTPVVNLGADINACGPQVLDAGNAYPGNVYTWSTGDSSQSISVYNTTGTYSVMINSPGGCSDGDTINVTSLAAPVVDLGSDTTMCMANYTLDAGNPGSSYAWSTGPNTQTIGLSAISTGTYSVTVTNTTTGCADMDTVTITLNPPVEDPILDDQVICTGSSAVLNGPNGYDTYFWTDGQLSSNNQTIVVSPGVNTYYVLTVGNSFGCTASDTALVVVEPLPNASFSAASAGIAVVNFANLSTPAAGATYSWNFGDGSANSSSANPSHTYAANGAYNVTLTVTTACGTDSTSMTIFINGISVIEIPAGEFSLYPNPTVGNVTIINPFGVAGIKLLDAAGKVVRSETLTQRINTVDYTDVPNGVYMVVLTTNTDTRYNRLVITK